jgi:hypothetical protein
MNENSEFDRVSMFAMMLLERNDDCERYSSSWLLRTKVLDIAVMSLLRVVMSRLK